ncbi:MAG: diaminopimelate epimerase [Elusimicrobia bacterium]|nr:diaminopimelate epimerase [Candidatus Liberimonas magnetica]
MNKKIDFYKISAAGNDFIMIDNRKKVLSGDLSSLAKRLCQRKLSIGADGLILIEKSKKADFKMCYYNSDGSHAAMCGNGGRSIARFANLLGITSKKMAFETDAGLVNAEILKNNIRLELYEPKDVRLDFPLKVGEKEFDVSFIDTGVPHTVVAVSNIDKIDVCGLGQMIRYHKEFSPAGTNVDFIQKKNENTIYVRTYERGVEDETLACGTGVVASAIIASMKKLVKEPVHCITRGGDTLYVSFTLNTEDDFISPVSNVHLEGPAEVTFTGSVNI